MDVECVELPREECTEEDQDLKEMFIIQLENLTHSLLLQIDLIEKVPKAKFDNQLRESANRVLDTYLKEVDTIPEICDKVYAIGRAISLGKKQRIDEYGRKEQQSKLYREQEQECHVWSYQNLNPGKTAAIMTILEQMVDPRSWKEARGLTAYEYVTNTRRRWSTW